MFCSSQWQNVNSIDIGNYALFEGNKDDTSRVLKKFFSDEMVPEISQEINKILYEEKKQTVY